MRGSSSHGKTDPYFMTIQSMEWQQFTKIYVYRQELPELTKRT